ncbi:hypothetical protein [Parenemella sanctibonifatiensis]|uniref:hypothetical protein n=1 Tax=Parenemella sanctibonifatiensis TaxID=2016505 RepID=UPI0015C5AAAD|nr:hypothetical protein [Parenemella sanctibonifatiensis]
MTVAGFDLEKGVFSMLPGLVDRALGFARSWFQGALEWVCGAPAALTEAGQRYLTLGQQVETLGTSISTNAIGVDRWTGEAADGFRTPGPRPARRPWPPARSSLPPRRS